MIPVSSVDQKISNHVKNYYLKLNQNQKIKLSQFYQTYLDLSPALHKHADQQNKFDFEAFSYAINRIPLQIFDTNTVILVKHPDDLKDQNINIEKWQTVFSPARRRSTFFNPLTHQLIFFINSNSDIDDIVNCLLAFQIEWNKLGKLITDKQYFINNPDPNILSVSPEEFKKLQKDLGQSWSSLISNNFSTTDLFIIKKASTYKYQDIVDNLWQENQKRFFVFDFDNQPLYFVSSNAHSLVNIIGGFVNQIQDKVFDYVLNNHKDIYSHWQEVKNQDNSLRTNDYLYFMSSIFLSKFPQYQKQMNDYHSNLGINNYSLGDLPSSVQIIPISSLQKSNQIDPYIKNAKSITNQSGYIVNLNYPLGMLANYLLNSFLKNKTKLRGVYIVGKAAILSGTPGDMQIPKVVLDERYGNIFHLKNCFNQNKITSPSFDIHYDQKAVSVYGTYLENNGQLQNYLKTDINIIEMESAPYLMSLASKYKDIHKPVSQSIDMTNLPVDLGIINYASDNPLNQTLGAGALGIKGVSSTYLSLLLVLQRIIDQHLSFT